jgi:hypothetical protein
MNRFTNPDFENIKPLYLLPGDNLADEVLIPSFKLADSVSCMAGFFSGAILASLAPGLATYINSTKNSLRIVVSPFIRPDDQKAIMEGMRSLEDVASEALGNLLITEDALQQHTLRCLSYLLRTSRLEMKIEKCPISSKGVALRIWRRSARCTRIQQHDSSGYLAKQGANHRFQIMD